MLVVGIMDKLTDGDALANRWEHALKDGTFVLPKSGLSHDAYNTLYGLSLRHNDAFWAAAARQLLQWDKPFTKVREGYYNDPASIVLFIILGISSSLA